MPDIFRHKTERCNVMCHNLEETLVGLFEFHYVPFYIVLLWHHKQDLHLMQSTSFFKNVVPTSTVLQTISDFATHTSTDDAGLCGLVTGLITFLIGVDAFRFFALIPSENVSGVCLFKSGINTCSRRAGKN